MWDGLSIIGSELRPAEASSAAALFAGPLAKQSHYKSGKPRIIKPFLIALIDRHGSNALGRKSSFERLAPSNERLI